ncbi:hypothetical protein [Herbiconiux sp. A18JL235]|uniref:Uncharacterized protein n=1 Tax=Herbiconiux sp. A18JL235 TaxID=3152363 RepID=A0AB39BL12_9MICO
MALSPARAAAGFSPLADPRAKVMRVENRNTGTTTSRVRASHHSTVRTRRHPSPRTGCLSSATRGASGAASASPGGAISWVVMVVLLFSTSTDARRG